MTEDNFNGFVDTIEIPSFSRRDFLKSLSIPVLSTVTSFFSPLNLARPLEDGKTGVLYYRSSNSHDAFDYKRDLERVLGPDVASEIKIVHAGEDFALLYNRNGDMQSSKKIATQHSKILNDADLKPAAAISNSQLSPVYDIFYSRGKDFDAVRRDYATVYTMLGSDLGKDLFIIKENSGNYALSYLRRGDMKSTLNAAFRHHSLLKGKGLEVSFGEEEPFEMIYGQSDFLNHRDRDLDKARVVRNKPQRELERAPIAFKDNNKGVGSNLEAIVEACVKKLRSKGLIASSDRTSWSVYDFESGKKLVSINEDEPKQAASMIKVPIAQGILHQVKAGKLRYSPKVREDMEKMIGSSDNPATNRLLGLLGGPGGAQRLLRIHYGGIFEDLRIVEYIPKNERTYRNMASAHDYSRYLYALWNDEVVGANELKRLMALPGRDRIYSDTYIPHGVKVYNKTGTTAKLCGDMGILDVPRKGGTRAAYTLIGIIERDLRGDYNSWKVNRGNAIRRVSEVVYDYMKKQHNLI